MSLAKEQLEEFGQSKRDMLNKIKALEAKVKLLEKESKRLQKKANEMEWGRLTDEP